MRLMLRFALSAVVAVAGCAEVGAITLEPSIELPSESTLRHAFECESLDAPLDDVLSAMQIALDGSPTLLTRPVNVFGLRTQRVAVFRDGGEDLYTAYFDAPLSQVVDAARLETTGDSADSRAAPNGVLSAWQDDGSSALRCTVTSY